MHCFSDQSAPEPVIKAINEDISVRMKLRSVNEYGMKTENFLDNIPLLAGDHEPESMWRWLEHIRFAEGFDSMEGISFRGIKNILFGKPRTEPTKIESILWEGPLSQGKEGVTVFSSNER